MIPHEDGHRLHCSHCGRAVQPTWHTRGGYGVDYYAQHGGHGERCEVVGDFAHPGLTFIRLLDHEELITCADCYRDPAVQAERERRFRPERAGDGDADGDAAAAEGA